MALVFLALGSNLGNSKQNILDAILTINLELGTVIRQSTIIESEPWGFASENKFANAVILIQTALDPYALLYATQNIEMQMGRTQKSESGYSDRVIDIDILLYDQQIIDQPTLCIPHPHITKRAFVYGPLLEIAPNIQLPGHDKMLKESV
jgi:2-amino-4-hydroxy-6-hydroxymethyldihydropteridine diphosphokinase